MKAPRTAALAAALFLAASALAQTSRGTVTGIVSDASAAAIPDAKVELVSVEQNTSRSSQTNAAGLYRFDAVDPGSYRVKVSKAGFTAQQTSPFQVGAAQVTTIDARLEVGQQATSVDVVAVTVELQTEAPVRLGTIAPQQATQLPIANRNAVALTLTLPGVSSNRGGFGVGTFSVNGGRGRSNNFLLDGTENNDISVAGQAFQVTNPDAIQEVAAQLSNFDAEFGRAGGAVVNTITKSGTNSLHGTAAYLAESTRLNAVTNTESLNAAVQRRGRPLPGTDQWFSGTIGGPIRKDKTFFFGAFQERRQASSSSSTVNVASAAGKATLRSLFPQGANPNVDLYLNATQGSDANAQLTTQSLGAGRPDIQIGTFVRSYAQSFRSTQPIVKVDHRINDNNLLMGRWAWDDQVSPFTSSIGVAPGFDTSQKNRYLNLLASYTRVFSPTITNELRLPYNRIKLTFPNDATAPLAQTLPAITIAGTTALGVASNIPQGRIANNYGLQDTMTIVSGRHSFRFGGDILVQRSRQEAPFFVRGTISFQASPGFTPFANFIDNFGGSGSSANRDFGSNVYYPDMNRTAFFFQDRWRATSSLTLTLGVRYEYFGLPMNSLRTPAYAGLFNINTTTWTGPFAEPNRVTGDRNNWAPTVGLAWSPSGGDGIIGKIIGEKKFVFRAGYQMGYDSFFNNIASNALSSTPNLVATSLPSVVDGGNPRGIGGWLGRIPTTPRNVLPIDGQTLMLPNLVNPYYQRWSAGVQRQLPANVLMDVSYVASKGTRLFLNEDLNPLVPANLRIQPAGVTPPYATQGRFDNLQGGRTVRTNGGSSSYHSLQVDVRKRMSKGLMMTGAYTWSKLLDNGSDIFAWGGVNIPSLAAIPSIFGGQPNERSVSAFDRTQRFVMSWVYDLPFMKQQNGFLGRAIGGWQISGVATFEAGLPFTVVNGVDADGIGGANDRPDYNPNGRRNVRAIASATSPTGFVNPDAGNAPIDRSEAMFIQLPACNITANPGGCRTGNLGRNTLRAPGINNFNVTLAKQTRIGERFSTELRGEFFNFFNHPQYGSPGSGAFQPASPALGSNVTTTLAGRFNNPVFMDGGARAVRLGLKILF